MCKILFIGDNESSVETLCHKFEVQELLTSGQEENKTSIYNISIPYPVIKTTSSIGLL